ncbi:MAG: hypothetical protein D3906_00945 [Candidatus Electrothrix sp. AUS1_2]|nr:hypothetical protein [Candidatus Electrothrix sp. AUS1_2]
MMMRMRRSGWGLSTHVSSCFSLHSRVHDGCADCNSIDLQKKKYNRSLAEQLDPKWWLVLPVYREQELDSEKTSPYHTIMTQIIVKSSSASHVKPLIQAALDHELRILKIGLEKTIRQLRQFEERF